ncbi:unnamed protein product [Peniophora sp. CBMAI 1063]|nr:unnamed protein product [Peniophora sp. CBMAI 1063]
MLALSSRLHPMSMVTSAPSIALQLSARTDIPSGGPASGEETPLLKITLGPLRILESTLPREYTIGRANTNDIVLGGKYSRLTSREHCKLIWDGNGLSILDLHSTNGTWINTRRLADDEVYLLHDSDKVTFTPVPLDDRTPADDPGGCTFFESRLGGRHALQCLYTEHTLSTLETKMSSVGAAVRRSLDELVRIRRAISPLDARTQGHANPAVDTSRTYRGSLDRPQRPETPVYGGPLPLHDDPEQRERLRMRPGGLWSGPEDPNGLPADHPDLIWRRGVRYKHTPGVCPPPLEMRQWSELYSLPVGLHDEWSMISPIAYGGFRHLTDAERTRLIPYVRDTYPDYVFPEKMLSDTKPPSDVGLVDADTAPVASVDVPTPPSVTRSDHLYAANSSLIPPWQFREDVPPVLHPSTPSVPHVRKRHRLDESLDDERPSKRIALGARTEVRPPSQHPLRTLRADPDKIPSPPTTETRHSSKPCKPGPDDRSRNSLVGETNARPARPSPPPSSRHGGADTRPGPSSHVTANATPEAPPVQRTALSPSAVSPTSTTIRPSLKRSRRPDDATIARPAKRVAVSATLGAHPRILSSPLGASPCRTSPPSEPHALSARPVATTPSSHTAPDSVPQVPSPSARARTLNSIDETLCIPDIPGAAHVAKSHTRKRKREDDADAATTEEAPAIPVTQPDDAPSPIPRPSDGSDEPQPDLTSRKQRRTAQTSAPIRRSLRVREKAKVTIRS